MSKQTDRDLVVALDIGTSKVVSLVGEIGPDGEIEIIGVGSHPSTGLKRGVVVNIEATVQSIQRATEDAELMAGCEIHSSFTGIAGSHIRSINSHGVVAIRDTEVSAFDIDRVIDSARAVAIPPDQQVLHVLPQEYIIDHQPGIRDPIGMSGVRLEAKVHIVTGAVSSAQNIVKCVKRCGLAVGDIVLEQLASSYAVLTDDERELGVCMVDIGGGTTDIAIFTDGAIRHTAVIPIAGDQVTNDIAVALRTPTQAAEEIKINHSSVAKIDLENGSEIISVPGVNERPGTTITQRALTRVVHARYEELLHLIHAELRRSGFDSVIGAGIVFTGGASKVRGMTELAESIFKMPIRIGTPRRVRGLADVINNPIYATSIGLLMHAKQQQHSHVRSPNAQLGHGMKSVWGRMREWIQGNF